MDIVRFTAIERHYGGRCVFAGLSGVVTSGEKIGLVGPNGAGKSSLARILAGSDQPDGGRITRERDIRLGYLAQEASEGEEHTLQEAFESALSTGQAQEWQMRAGLDRFGFHGDDLRKPLRAFSGGQRTRALLARTLLTEPDWLILDEPTNHLDLATTRRLENLLLKDPRAALIISHDRAFLENVATRIWELDDGELSVYAVTPGRAYGMYLEQRVVRREQQQRAYEKAMDERARRQAVIDELRTHGSHNYTAVHSRERALGKVTPAQAPRAERRAISVTLRAARRATNGIAIEVSGLAKAYTQTLFSDVDAAFARGERIAIIGPNGAGKSTFLRIIAGDLAPDRGSVRYGTGLRTASYTQSSADDLPAGASATQAVMQMGVTNEEARELLGRMRLGGEAADKPVEAFSGGERRRIMLARLMSQHADCLFLDEPTNDLDIASREALEAVLASYEGALFIVSHDRYLLRNLSDRVVAIQDGIARIIEGDYATYERIEREREEHALAQNTSITGRGDQSKTLVRRAAHENKRERERRKREVGAAEQHVVDLENEQAALEHRFAAPETYDDPRRVVELQHAMERLRGEIAKAMRTWEHAVEAYEEYAEAEE